MVDNANYIPLLIELMKKTGENILEFYYKSHQFEIQSKSDSSPLTQADLVAHEKITQGLADLTPTIPILSEEDANIPFSTRQTWKHYWLVDPLDGTKEFIRHSGDFSINIALIENHSPVLGAIYAPVLNKLYYAVRGQGAYKQEVDKLERIYSRQQLPEKIIFVVGHHYKIEKLQSFLAGLIDYEMVAMGSSLKFGLIAEGKADIYPRKGLTNEWDTAAGQIILEEAGGKVVDFSLEPLHYNTKDSLLNPSFVAVANTQVLEKMASTFKI